MFRPLVVLDLMGQPFCGAMQMFVGGCEEPRRLSWSFVSDARDRHSSARRSKSAALKPSCIAAPGDSGSGGSVGYHSIG